MEKILAMLIVVSLGVGCQSEREQQVLNRPSKAPIDTTNDDLNDPSPMGPAPTAFSLKASRGNSPSNWNNGTYVMTTTSIYNIPEEIKVQVGYSGLGWLSLYASGRKFCYQGNASSDEANDGNLFVLVKEKSNITEECFSNIANTTYDTEVYLEQNSVVDLEVNGGGCSVGKDLCLFTEVIATIYPIK